MPGVEAAFLLLTPPSPRAPTGSSCFLWQSYGDAVDHVVVMFSKLMTKMERQADDALDEQLGQHKNTIYSALGALARLGPLILDETLPEHGLRAKLFAQVPRDELAERVARATAWVSGRKSDSLHGVVSRYGTLRKFTPAFPEAVSFLQEDGSENGPRRSRRVDVMARRAVKISSSR